MKIELAKNQPCGCVTCTCENETQCQGCGAKYCYTATCALKGNRGTFPAFNPSIAIGDHLWHHVAGDRQLIRVIGWYWAIDAFMAEHISILDDVHRIYAPVDDCFTTEVEASEAAYEYASDLEAMAKRQLKRARETTEEQKAGLHCPGCGAHFPDEPAWITGQCCDFGRKLVTLTADRDLPERTKEALGTMIKLASEALARGDFEDIEQ